MKVLQEKCDLLSAKIKRLYNLYGASGDKLLLETINETKKELISISKMLENEKSSVAAVSEVVERNKAVKNLRNCWDNLTIKEKQRALRLCIDKIIVTDDSVDIEYLI